MTSRNAGRSAGSSPRDELAALTSKTDEAEQFLKTLANAHRLMILCHLQEGECCVADLQDVVGLGQSSLSQHLAKLRKDRLVKARRNSRMIFYSLDDARVTRVIQLLSDIFCAPRP